MLLKGYMVASSNTILMGDIYKVSVPVWVETQVNGRPCPGRELAIMLMIGGKVPREATPYSKLGDIGLVASQGFEGGAHAGLGVRGHYIMALACMLNGVRPEGIIDAGSGQ